MSLLRVVWPDDLSARPASRMPTLTEFYKDFVLPLVRRPRGAPDSTIQQDRVALGHWVRLTRDPPISEIDAALCARFVASLMERGLAPATVRKIVIHLQFIIDHAGPADRRHRNTAEILTKVPFLERPRQIASEPRPSFIFHEIEALLEMCRQMTATPRIAHPNQAIWWASLIRFAWHTGLRRSNLLNVRWSWVSEDGWLTIPPAHHKQNKGQMLYLSTAACAAASRVRIAGEDRMFAWNGTWSYLRKKWGQLVAALPANRRFGWHAIRRATLTWLAERNPLVSRLVAGHRKLDVLEDFYCQRSVVVGLLESMPIPRGWDL